MRIKFELLENVIVLVRIRRCGKSLIDPVAHDPVKCVQVDLGIATHANTISNTRIRAYGGLLDTISSNLAAERLAGIQ